MNQVSSEWGKMNAVRRPAHICLRVVGCCLVLGWLAGCASLPKGSGSVPKVIWSVKFEFYDTKGNQLKRGQLSSQLSAMNTSPTSFGVRFTRLFGKYKIYKNKTIREDLQRLKALYRYNGYYEPQFFFSEEKDLKILAGANAYRRFQRVEVRIRIVEGPQIKITQLKYKWPKKYVWLPPNSQQKSMAGLSVGIEWQNDMPKEKRLKDVLKKPILVKGSPFSTPQYKLWKGVLSKRLQDRSFALAKVRGQVIINKDTQSAEITMWVIPLIPCRFGRVQIVNNKRVGTDLIRNLITFKRGDKTYNVQKLINSQRQLFAQGLFRTVSVKPDLKCARYRLVKRLGGKLSPKQQKESGDCLKGWDVTKRKGQRTLAIPITIDIQEDKFQLIKFGAGVTVDGQRNQIDASVNWNFLHFFGGLRQLQLSFNPGWAFLPDVIRRFDNGPNITASATFKQPIFMDRQAEFGARILFRRVEEIGDADYTTLTPSISFSRPLFWRISGRISFNFELAFDVQNPLTLERENYQLAFFEQQIVLDLRDDPVNTTKGIFLTLTMQQALFGTFQYIKLQPEFRAFVPLPLGMVLAAKISYGVMWSQRTGESLCSDGQPCQPSIGDILRQSPLTQRFFAGGGNSVRGWTARFLGPLACRIQKQEFSNVTTSERVNAQGTSAVGVRVARQIQQRTVAVPDPKTPAGLTGRSATLYPLLNRGRTCQPARLREAQSRANDMASRRGALPFNGRPGVFNLPELQSLQVVPTGGNHLIEGSIELRIPLTSLIGLVAFVDAGVIQVEPQIEVPQELIPSVSVGGGVRLRTAIGALRLDFAGRINADDLRYPLQRHWEIHFSFGEAF